MRPPGELQPAKAMVHLPMVILLEPMGADARIWSMLEPASFLLHPVLDFATTGGNFCSNCKCFFAGDMQWFVFCCIRRWILLRRAVIFVRTGECSLCWIYAMGCLFCCISCWILLRSVVNFVGTGNVFFCWAYVTRCIFWLHLALDFATTDGIFCWKAPTNFLALGLLEAKCPKCFNRICFLMKSVQKKCYHRLFWLQAKPSLP
ncbi:hypothetical protein VPH35_048913 [Triticum aestivum]